MFGRSGSIGWLANPLMIAWVTLLSASCAEIEQTLAPVLVAPDPGGGEAPTQVTKPPQPKSPKPSPAATALPQTGAIATVVGARQPVAVVRFDDASAPTGQALTAAIGELLTTRPDAAFDVVAVMPPVSNASRVVPSAEAARQQVEGVIQTLTGLGASAERIQIFAATSRDVEEGEMRVYVR